MLEARHFISATVMLVVAALVFLAIRPADRTVNSRFTAADSPSPNQFAVVATPLPVILPATTSRHGMVHLSLDAQLYPGQEQALGAQLATALELVSARFFGRQPKGPIEIAFLPEANCALSGISHTTARAVQIFTCTSIAPAQAVAIAAHEFVHQLANDHYPPLAQGSDMILVEGLATWGAGDYWLNGQPCFAEVARQQQAAGRLLPLATNYTSQSSEVMNDLYYQWASFVEYLLNRYGIPAFDRAYASGDGTPGSADYRAAFGQDLATIEADWLASLTQPGCPAKG